MLTKLTLRIDSDLITKVKNVAKQRNKSVSQIVAEYFKIMQQIDMEQDKQHAPITQSLKGILPADINEDEYKEYLEDKYL